jgi:hypothetical protein
VSGDFATWWDSVVTRLEANDYGQPPEPKPVDHDAFEAGMHSDEWAWAYYHADAELASEQDG